MAINTASAFPLFSPPPKPSRCTFAPKLDRVLPAPLLGSRLVLITLPLGPGPSRFDASLAITFDRDILGFRPISDRGFGAMGLGAKSEGSSFTGELAIDAATLPKDANDPVGLTGVGMPDGEDIGCLLKIPGLGLGVIAIP